MDSLNLQSDTIAEPENLIEQVTSYNWSWEGTKKATLEVLSDYGPRLLLAVAVLLIGLWLIKLTKRVLKRALKRRKLDITARKFIIDFTGALLTVMLLISVLSLFGVPTTSFIAILGAGGLAIGLAVQGALQNFAGGILILLFHPYRVGHLIETDGVVGYVREIQVFNTILVTLDNKRVIVPNGPLMNKNITNMTEEGSVRVDLTVDVDYNTNLQDAIRIINEALAEDPKVLSEPAPMVGVAELGDSGIRLFARPFTKPQLYWDTHMDCLKRVREALLEGGINIPFPQRELSFKKGHALKD